MQSHRSSRSGLTALIACALMGSVVACSPTAGSSVIEASDSERVDRSNYIVTLMRTGAAPQTAEAAAEARRELEAERDEALQAVFGAQGPRPGASFVSAYAFEIRLTAEEAARLARHSAVVHVQADQLHRPMGAGPAG
ncbi:protease inhibitor I9 family protein [Oceanicaulis sp. MMSF_3324]|uniref:protease inhibitor I9 family protein n=1 Tax=Oceanicaulis sp. MMSF_3324 TaxID=3046702 RepID=UPI00273F0C0D|nr:protease inhibitor I9 family protein [Oceanicaulis sp. MMSF_3324]